MLGRNSRRATEDSLTEWARTAREILNLQVDSKLVKLQIDSTDMVHTFPKIIQSPAKTEESSVAAVSGCGAGWVIGRR